MVALLINCPARGLRDERGAGNELLQDPISSFFNTPKVEMRTQNESHLISPMRKRTTFLHIHYKQKMELSILFCCNKKYFLCLCQKTDAQCAARPAAVFIFYLIFAFLV